MLPRAHHTIPESHRPPCSLLAFSPLSAEFAFCQVDASIALALAPSVLCDLLQQWDQMAAALPVLLGWLLDEGDDLTTINVDSTPQVSPGVAGSQCPDPTGHSTAMHSWAWRAHRTCTSGHLTPEQDLRGKSHIGCCCDTRHAPAGSDQPGKTALTKAPRTLRMG